MSVDITGVELKKRIAEILKDADLETTSAKKVRMQLEEDTKSDLTHRKEEIGKLIQEVIDDMEDEEEEEEEKPKNGDVYSPKKNGAAKESEDESEEDTPSKKPARRAAAAKKSKYKEDSNSEESEEYEFSENEKPKKPTPNAGRGFKPEGEAKLDVEHKIDADECCDEESEEKSVTEPSDSDYDPDKDSNPISVRPALRSSGRRPVVQRYGPRRKLRGNESNSEQSMFDDESSGEEWGKRQSSRSKRRGKKQLKYDSNSDSD